jgi:23S rRNA pseudouridine1911/1915/1917 synthase
MPSRIQHQGSIPEECSQDRLDQVVATLFPQYSRSRLQSWIKSGELLVNGVHWKSKDKVSGGESVEIDAVSSELVDEAENIPLDIIYEDDALLIINKPSELVVHPGAGNRTGTLLNALLHYCPELSQVPRAGIVHRLDKDTTGLMVVARSIESQTNLVQQLQSRSVKRLYEAVVYGVPPSRGKVDAPIGRHRLQRTRMAIQPLGKEAITRYRLIEAYTSHAHMEFSLETGRTHQIRVHMQHLGFPLVGDPGYGGQFRVPKKGGEMLGRILKEFPRQALHAKELSFVHPVTSERVTYHQGTPQDLGLLLDTLEADMSILDV